MESFYRCCGTQIVVKERCILNEKKLKLHKKGGRWKRLSHMHGMGLPTTCHTIRKNCTCVDRKTKINEQNHGHLNMKISKKIAYT